MDRLKKLQLFLPLLFCLQLTTVSARQYRISGVVRDDVTKLTLDSAVIIVHSETNLYHTFRYTNISGLYTLDSLPAASYSLSVMRRGYAMASRWIVISDSSIVEDIDMYKSYNYAQDTGYIDDIAAKDVYHGAFSSGFYNPPLLQDPALFNSSFNIEWTTAFKAKLTRFDQIGFEFSPSKLTWHFLKNDTINSPQVYKKEKYFGYYWNFFVFNRLIITKQKRTGHPGLFMDIGAGYDLPLYFRYSYFTEKDHKSIVKNIHNFKEFSGLFRLGFDVASIKVSYRFFDILKYDYTQPPKLKVGIELNFPEREVGGPKRKKIVM